MADYAALRATAKTLIDADGRSVTIRKLGDSPSSDDQMPWRSDTEPVKESVTGAGLFVTDSVREGLAWSMVRSMVDGMAMDNAVFMFAAANDGGHDLEGFHEVVDGAKTWRIMRVEVLKPGDTRLLYAIEVR